MGRRILKSMGDRFIVLWLMHFGDIPPGEATCYDCADYQAGLCKGGSLPVQCMLYKARTAKLFVSGSFFESLE